MKRALGTGRGILPATDRFAQPDSPIIEIPGVQPKSGVGESRRGWIDVSIPPPEVTPFERNFRTTYATTANTDTVIDTILVPEGITFVWSHYGFWADTPEIGTSRTKLLQPHEFMGATGKPGLTWVTKNDSLIPNAEAVIAGNPRHGLPWLIDFGDSWRKTAPLVISGRATVRFLYRNVGVGPDFIVNIGFACMGWTIPTNMLPDR